MAKPWNEVEQSDAYKALSPAERIAAKQEYWNTVVEIKPEYNSLPPQEKLAAKTEFLSNIPTVGQANTPKMIMGRNGVMQFANPMDRMKAQAQISAQSKTNPVETQMQKDVGTLDVKRQVYTKDLENFLTIDDVLQDARGKGLGRITAGGKMTWEGFKQDSPLGRAVATHDATRKRLRVQLVRAAGDVGNINIVEQKAAEMMIPTQWDDAKTAELKRAYLKEIGRAINDKDGNAVKETISGFMGSPVFQSARDKYNTLRAKGKSPAEAKKLLGL